jgi:glycosyltransferase involved in cell wall biosynthesis
MIVGTLTKQKNHERLLRAFESVNSDVPNSSLIIVGDGPLSADLKTLANKLGIDGSTHFTGYLPRREDVYAVMKRCNLGVFPSWYEGFCVAAVEAMAVGLPVVVSDIDVLNEVVGDPGVYADPNNPTEFADAITNLLKNPQKRERLGISAKERARAKFTLERTAKKYYEVYNQVADKLC